MIFGEYFFKRKVRKLIEDSRSREHRFCNLDEAGSILILCREEDRLAIEPQLKKLRSMKKQIRCVFSSKDAVSQPDDSSLLFIDKSKEADKYGIPNDEVSAKVAKIPADILIDLSRGKCHVLKVLMLQHQAAFKIGESLPDSSFYDFSISMTERGGTADLFEYLLFYLQSIRSK